MDRVEAIKNCYLFRGVNEDDLAVILAMAEPKIFIAGDLLYDSGSDGDAIYLIVIGNVELRRAGIEAPIAIIGDGQILGELAFFHPAKRSVAALVREPTHVLKISFERLTQLLGERPALALNVCRNGCGAFAKYLQDLTAEVRHRYF